MSHDKERLANIPPDRLVHSLVAAGNTDEHGGVIIKFALQSGTTTETLTLLRREGGVLLYGLALAREHGALPHLSNEERAALVASMPKIEDYDWNLQKQSSRIVSGVRFSAIPTGGFAFEFVMTGGGLRHFLISRPLAAFLFEYLYQYRHLLDDPNTTK